jgi:hypothetical protein
MFSYIALLFILFRSWFWLPLLGGIKPSADCRDLPYARQEAKTLKKADF